MPALVLDGRAVADDLRAALRPRIVALRERGIHPRLAIVIVGDDPASRSYVRMLLREGERLGIAVNVDRLEATGSAGIRGRLAILGGDDTVSGILLQQPLPNGFDVRAVADAMPLEKDVDCTHPVNVGALLLGDQPAFVPATPTAVLELLGRSPHGELRGRTAVVIGRSRVVGKPVAALLVARDATVTVLHSKSQTLQPYLREADVVVAAAGAPGLVRGEDLSKGATVIDVGTTQRGGSIVGDVDFDDAVNVAGAITPVPGGVGPVTSVTLLRNVVTAAERASK